MKPSTIMTALATATLTSAQSWRMPDEGDPHNSTWMAFAFNETLWEDLLPIVQQNLADVAAAIARFEPVNMLMRPEDKDTANKLLNGAPNVTLVEGQLDDLWIRDSGPVFVRSDNDTVAGVNFNFNGWGNKQWHADDSLVAGAVAADAGVPVLSTDLVIEGGAIEVDGNGTAIMTESCVLNDNRNPGWTKERVEGELKRLLGITKVIWLPGIAGKDITDGHTDFYARFVGPGQVVAGYDPDPASFDHNVTTTHLDILRNATDAGGQPLNVTVMTAPATVRKDYRDDEDFAVGYINFYLCNGGVIAPQFGDAQADTAAFDILQSAFPDREIVQVNIDGIAAGGGGIHCATQQEILHASNGTAGGNGTTAEQTSAASGARPRHSRGRKWMAAFLALAATAL